MIQMKQLTERKSQCGRNSAPIFHFISSICRAAREGGAVTDTEDRPWGVESSKCLTDSRVKRM